MNIVCPNCEKANLQNETVQLSGDVRTKTYHVEMPGLKCRTCDYATLDGVSMPEFGRLLADKYREENGLLTSVDIRTFRKSLNMNQEQFAAFIGAGSASVKRWELGKIQDLFSDARIRSKMPPPKPVFTEIRCYVLHTERTTGPEWRSFSSATWVRSLGGELDTNEQAYVRKLVSQTPCANSDSTANCGRIIETSPRSHQQLIRRC